MSTLILMSLVGPLLASVLALALGRSRTANTVIQLVLAASSAVGLANAVALFYRFATGAQAAAVVPFLGFTATFDAWSVAFLALINLGVLLASLFAIGYLPKYEKTYSLPTLNFVSGLFILGMQATVLASNVFVFLLFWEVMSIAAYFLVIADREAESLKAGFIYFVMTHLGVACLLAGFLILAKGDVMATFATLATNASTLSSSMLALAFFLLFAGFGSKAGLVPLHQWLPYAHPQAPSHSSALMSGVMLKIALYGFLRVAFSVFVTVPLSWAMIVVAVGLLSAFYGVLMAAVETDFKRLLAWSSVENLGLIFAMIGMGFVFQAMALPATPFFVAALIHALNHTIFKSGFFLAAGSVISETHTRDLDDMGGLANKWPVFSMACLGLVFAAAALPPLGTFYGEWVFLQHLAANVVQGSILSTGLLALVLSIVALIGGLAIFTFAKTFSALFLSKPRSEHVEHVKPLNGWLVWPIWIATVLSFGVGLLAAPISGLFANILSTIHPLPSVVAPVAVSGGMISAMFVLIFTAVLGVAVVLFRRLATSQRPIRVTDTWDCGQPLTARMEYTATGFASPIRFFFRSILLSEKRMVTERVAPENAWVLKRRLEWTISSIWEKWAYEPLARAVLWTATQVKRLQSGVIQFYILLVLVTLILVLIFAV